MELVGSSGVRIEHQHQQPQLAEDVPMKEEDDSRRTTGQHESFLQAGLIQGALEDSQVSLMNQEQTAGLIKQTLLGFQEEMMR
jgi:hypothetical protein